MRDPRGASWRRIRRSRLWRFAVCETPDCHQPSEVADHRVPLWEGGTSTPDNCQVLCLSCHARKSAEEASRRAARRRMVRTHNDRRYGWTA